MGAWVVCSRLGSAKLLLDGGIACIKDLFQGREMRLVAMYQGFPLLKYY